jgi:hypothetical protein
MSQSIGGGSSGGYSCEKDRVEKGEKGNRGNGVVLGDTAL